MAARTKVLGLTGSVTIDSTDYEIESVTYKVEIEQNEYLALGSSGWPIQVVGGAKKITGDFEFAYDSFLVKGTGNMKPLTDTLATMVINFTSGDHVSFSAHIHELSGDKKTKGLHKIKCAYASSGIPTWTFA